jgi:hypothetical protein
MAMLSMQPFTRSGTVSELEKCEKRHSLIFGETADSENKGTAAPAGTATTCVMHLAHSNARLCCRE